MALSNGYLKGNVQRDCIKQHNIIINVLFGWSGEVDLSRGEFFGGIEGKVYIEIESLTGAFKVLA